MSRALATATTLLILALTLEGAPGQPPSTNTPAPPSPPAAPLRTPPVPINTFLNGLSDNPDLIEDALDYFEEHWNPSLAVPLLELAVVADDPAIQRQIDDLIAARTGQRPAPSPTGPDHAPIYAWAWRNEFGLPANYAELKAELYATVDPDFREFFSRGFPARVRLDEVLWSGVERDEIPPLREPKVMTASQATYLAPNNVVFGLEVNGEARAYPRRIVAWHEVVHDPVGGERLLAIYGPPSGAMTVYRATAHGTAYELETSGFVFRSDKLLFDEPTKSLWSALSGQPLVGRLASQEVALELVPVVTTTWGEWRKRHPGTKVLSLDTGYVRNYGEGVAHAAYFASDAPMFPMPLRDSRLGNKTEVLALRTKDGPGDSVAFSIAFLVKNPVIHGKLGTEEIVVLTDTTGANRVYEAQGQIFASWDRQSTAIDSRRQVWTVSESGLKNRSGLVLKRVPAHRVFWFAWVAQYPATRLVK
jgi:hypothetical protein